VRLDVHQFSLDDYLFRISDFFKEGFELTPLIEDHRANSVWGEFASDLMNGKFLWPKAGSHDDQAHPPIHPTKNVELADLVDPDEKKIYELVTIHFLACCAQDAKGKRIAFFRMYNADCRR
jgi:DNA topoisomerase III